MDEQNRENWNLNACRFVTLSMRLAILFMFISCPLWAQRTIQGQIRSAETGTGIQDVNIFVPGSTLGTSTDVTGVFKLEIPVTVQDLFITHVSYKSLVVPLTDQNEYEWKLVPETTQLREVALESSQDREWKNQFRKFKNAFIGSSFNAGKCTIDNFWVLEFENEGGILRAYAPTPLEITNEALGYRITFLLEHFYARNLTVSYGGNFHFEELDGDDKEMKRWERNRMQVYEGSMKHFLNALANDKLAREGFVVHYATRNAGNGDFTISRLADYEELIAGDPPLLNHQGHLRILYTPSGDQKQVSYLEITGVVPLSREGFYPNSEHLKEFGYWNSLRMAELLPNDYTPTN